MIIERIISEGLAHNSYYIGSGTEAVIIDPRRDVEVYVDLAKKYNQRIVAIFETHRNEDFTIGSLNLSKLTGSPIYHGSRLDFRYGERVDEGDVFKIGSAEIGILETPGHTDESLTYTLKETGEKEVYAAFTGDSLFAGDVGRTDLYGESHVRRLSEALYESLFDKFLNLGDGVIVFPGHGAGSVCGGSISVKPFTTIGYEKKTNRILQLKDKNDFMAYKIQERLERPPYFTRMELYNRIGPPLNDLPKPHPLKIGELKKYFDNSQIVDVRPPEAFYTAHIPGSINIWASGLPLFAGWVLDYEQPIIIVKDENQLLDHILRYLYRLGFDNIEGYLNNISEWFKSGGEYARTFSVSVEELKNKLSDSEIFLLDVRDSKTYSELGFIQGAYNIYLGHLKSSLSILPGDRDIYVYCDSGFKTGIAVSILLRAGFTRVFGLIGGFSAWVSRNFPVQRLK